MWEIDGKLTDDESVVMAYFNLKYPPMIKSLTDTDFYKYSMGQVYHHQFSTLEDVWDLRCRNVGAGKVNPEKYTAEDREEITNQIRAYCALRYTKKELAFLARNKWLKNDYLEFLKNWKAEFEDFKIADDTETGLALSAGETGRKLQDYISYYEIPVLAITTEVYYRNHFDYEKELKASIEATEKKIAEIKSGKYHLGTWSEFGCRRRLSFEFQDYVVRRFAEEKLVGFIGTSNVYLAMKYDLKAIGTCAHQFIEDVGQGDPSKNIAYSNKFAMEAWVKEYGILNGIWLTDTVKDVLCRRDMKLTYSTLYGGVRNDSGNPYEWADNWLAHFQHYYEESKDERVNPKIKTLLFSNNINSFAIWDGLTRYVEDKAKAAFGIGTWFSGPQTIPALQNVMKVVMVNGHHVAKISDDEGKEMSRSREYVQHAKGDINWRIASGE